MQWLSKGNFLRHFVVLSYSIVSLLNEKEKGKELKTDIFYLSDVFEKLDYHNKWLQGHYWDLISNKEAINAFLGKLNLYSLNILVSKPCFS